ACSVGAAAGGWPVTNPTVSIVSPVLWLSPTNTSVIASVLFVGSSIPIVHLAVSPPCRQSTQSWALARWRTFWGESHMAELVEPYLSGAAQTVCPHSVRW